MSKSTQSGSKKNISTLEGKKRLGDLLAQAQEAHNMNQEDFAAHISQKSHGSISEGQLRTLISGLYRESSRVDAYLAIVGAGVLKHKNGDPFTMNDIAAVISEQWNPFSNEPTVDS